MDKITKVQEVSSFIVNFDNKYWNEVILRLTIIGIRYVTNNYRSIFSWKLKDLNIILDKLNKSKQQKKNNFKSKSKNLEKKEFKKETKKEKNSHCRNNSVVTKTKENNSSIKEKKNINISSSFLDVNEINFNDNNDYNDSMLLLSERNANMDNNKYYQKIKKNKEDMIYLNNKSVNNNINNNLLSLKQNSFNYNKNKINVVMSDFPFHNENKIDKYAKNRNNFIFDFTQEQKAQINLDNLKNDIKEEKINYNNENNSYLLERISKPYMEFHTFESKKKNKNPKFLEDITLAQKYNCKNSSQEFISELRKMSHSKEIVKSNPKKISVNNSITNTYYSQPKLNLSYNSSFNENKNIQNKAYLNSNINNNLTLNKTKDKYEKMNKIKYTLLLKNNDYKKSLDENKEKMIQKTFNNKYNFIATNDNLEINFQYGLNNIDINNINNNINNTAEKNPIRLNTNNKYLKNPKKETKLNPTTDIALKNKLKMNFDYTFNKENNNSLNLENEYSAPNTDRYTSKYLNEIQSKTNKSIINNNSLSVSREIIKEETKEKESDKKDDKINNNSNINNNN